MALTEKRLREVLNEEFAKVLKPYEEARKQTWDNHKDIVAIQTEKKTVKWNILALFGLVSAITSFTATIIPLGIFFIKVLPILQKIGELK